MAFPSAGTNAFPYNGSGGSGIPNATSGQPRAWNTPQAGSWAYQILPYAEQNQVYVSLNGTSIVNALIPIYFCPSRRAPTNLSNGRGAFDYYGNAQSLNAGNGNTNNATCNVTPEGVFRPFCNGRINMLGITDGTSNTIGVGEKNVCLKTLNTGQDLTDNQGYCWGWDAGGSGNWDNTVKSNRGTVIPGAGVVPDLTASTGCFNTAGTLAATGTNGTHGFGSSHPGGMNALFMDGTVRFVRNIGSANTLPPTIAGYTANGRLLNVIAALSHVSDGYPNPVDY
jgi:prepilin-type processing-associated H-X9-DG protein